MKNKNSHQPDQTEPKHSQSPWLDPDGNLYSTAALKSLSKTWDKKTWEKFLADTVDGATQEQLPTSHEYDEACEKNFETIFEQSVGEKREAPKDIKQLTKWLLRQLTTQQVRILKEIYWEGRNTSEVANILEVNEKQIRVQHTRSLKKLKDLLNSRTRIYTYSEGHRRFLAEIFKPVEASQTREEQIRDVYRKDCQMRFFKY